MKEKNKRKEEKDYKNKTEHLKHNNNNNNNNIFKQIIYFITIVLTIIYISYRIAFTLPIHLGALSLVLSIIILLLEIWESLDFFIYYFNILRVNRQLHKTPGISDITEFSDVDVLIATLNESESILKDTIISCKNMNYGDKSKVHIYVMMAIGQISRI